MNANFTGIFTFFLMIIIGIVVVAIGIVWYRSYSDLEISNSSEHSKKKQKSGGNFNELVNAGNVHYAEMRYQEALNYYSQAHRLNPKNPELNFKLGRIYQALEQYSHAETAFRSVLAIEPSAIEALYELSRVYHKMSKLSMGLKYINLLLEKQPTHQEAKKVKAKIMLEMNNQEASRELIEELLVSEPENTEIQFLLGKSYQKDQDWAKALEIYENILAKDPQDRKNIKYQIYLIFEKQGDHEKCIEVLESILSGGSGTVTQDDLKVELAKSWCKKARELQGKEQYEEAHECYNRANQYNPLQPEIYLGLGKIHAEQDDVETAVEYLLKAIELGSKGSHVYLDLARLYERLNRFDDAISYALMAEQMMPSAQVYYYLGTLYGLKGDIHNCISHLNRAISKDTHFTDAYYNLGVAYEQQRKFKEAMVMYKKTLALDKNHMEAKTNYKHLQHRMHPK